MASDRATLTSREIDQISSPVLVIALGSWEQHGPHLPLDTDTRIAEELVARLVQHHVDLVPGPTLTVSSSGEHAGFPGTLSIGGDAVIELLVELVRSAEWVEGVVIVNGHGGNVAHLERARMQLASEGRNVLIWSPPLVDPHDSHAGYVETSVMLAIEPSAVRIDQIDSGSTLALGDILDDLRENGVLSVSPTGVLGDPRRADLELGCSLLSHWEELLVAAVDQWRKAHRT